MGACIKIQFLFYIKQCIRPQFDCLRENVKWLQSLKKIINKYNNKCVCSTVINDGCLKHFKYDVYIFKHVDVYEP